MKKQILTLSILSSALNINHVMADDILKMKPDCEVNIVNGRSLLALSCLQISELSDKELRNQLEKAVADLVSVSFFSSPEKEGEEKVDKLEKALKELKTKVELVENKQPEVSITVKSKILGEFLRTGLVVIDQKETLDRDRVQLDFNQSIIRELERRQEILDIYSKGGTICL